MFSRLKSNTLYFSCLLAIGSCSTQAHEQSEAKVGTTKEEPPIAVQSTGASRTDKSHLFGIWWDSKDEDAPHAVFMIKDSTVTYPDSDSEEGELSTFLYSVKGDSLTIDFDGFKTTSKIAKLTKDTLTLITDVDTLVLIKRKK